MQIPAENYNHHRKIQIIFDAKSILAASCNSVSHETVSNSFQKCGFCEASKYHHEEHDSEVTPRIWEYVQEKMNVTVMFEEYV
jgi:hypothetical protein